MSFPHATRSGHEANATGCAEGYVPLHAPPEPLGELCNQTTCDPNLLIGSPGRESVGMYIPQNVNLSRRLIEDHIPKS